MHSLKFVLKINLGIDIQSKNCTDGEIRLIGGPSSNKGRLEVCIDSTWATVCDASFSIREGSVACRQLGYQSYGILDKNCDIHS